MRWLASALVLWGALFSLGGCYRELPPPKPPDQEVPDVPEGPTEAPREPNGRLIVDANGERATVSRVVERVEPPTVRPMGASGAIRDLQGAKTELLCITPCALDLPRGAHTLVFTSKADSSRTSSVDVGVSRGTAVVRHAIGERRFGSAGLVIGGVMMLGLGAALAFLGTPLAIDAATSEPTRDAQGQITNDPRRLLPLGLVLAGAGVALGATGGIFLALSRGELQSGTTTQFRVP
jgi:hypothetical protein